MSLQAIDIFRATVPFFDAEEQSLGPLQPAPARGAPAARFLGKEVGEVERHPDRARLIVEYNHQARAKATTRLLNRAIIHRDIQVIRGEKVG